MHTVYCPRCERKYSSSVSRVEAMALLREHVKKHDDPQRILEQLEPEA